MAKKRLSLTIEDDPIIELDGVDYVMIHPDKLRSSASMRIQNLHQKIVALSSENEDDCMESDRLIGAIIRILVPTISKEIAENVGTRQYQKLMGFLDSMSTLDLTGVDSSPDSSDSTEDPPAIGSISPSEQ